MIRGMLFCLALLLTGCTAPAPSPLPATPENETVAPAGGQGYLIEEVVSGLQGPTQMIMGPDGRLWIAQLAGGENAQRGEVIAVDPASNERETLLSGLDKPTGIAVLDNALWIATRRALLRAPLGPDYRPDTPVTVLEDLPYNGRSNGTLTVTPERQLLFETSGARSGNAAQAGSATLWQLDPANPTQPQPLATGLKGAYAHAFDTEGRLWTTEIGDDPVNGEAPPDELNWVVPGADFGWPQCFGFQEPAENYGGTRARCAVTRAPVVLFPPRATPTGVAPSPWEADALLVALWLTGEVVRVPITVHAGDADEPNATGAVEAFVDGLRNPQHLLVTEANELLVSDFAAGAIYQILRDEGQPSSSP
jgi:glucose/arabinose dehydrogenase